MTVKDIAELAGVSIGTIDRVIHNRGQVSTETEKKIREIIDKHGYTPNPIARRLKRNRAYRFCALVPRRDRDSGYWEQIIQGIEIGAQEIEALGIETEIIEFDYKSKDFEKAAKETLRKAPDGVIFPPFEPKRVKFFIEGLDGKCIPYVFFDSDLPGAKPICTIGQDSFKGGYLAGQLLHLFIGKNITRSVAVFCAPLSYHIGRRKDGFLHYASEHGIEATVINYKKTYSNEEIANNLSKQPDLQGVFVSYVDVHHFAEAAAERRKNGVFFIVGYDLVPANHKLLKEGRIDAIICQRPQEQSRLALLCLYRQIVLGNSIDTSIKMPLDIYVQANIPDIIDSHSAVAVNNHSLKEPSAEPTAKTAIQA
jgi:LacI family transcriptional regulator